LDDEEAIKLALQNVARGLPGRLDQVVLDDANGPLWPARHHIIGRLRGRNIALRNCSA